LKLSLSAVLIILVGMMSDTVHPRKQEKGITSRVLRLVVRDQFQNPVPGIKIELFKKRGDYDPTRIGKEFTSPGGEVAFILNQPYIDNKNYSLQIEKDPSLFKGISNYPTIPEDGIIKLTRKKIYEDRRVTITGRVYLEDQSAIPGVKVEVKDKRGVTITNEDGNYLIGNIEIASERESFQISAVLEGFKTGIKTITIAPGYKFNIDFELITGAIRQEIVVTGKSPVIDVRKSASAINISKEVFTKLPKGRECVL
jgi:hypothetical protein